MEVSNLAFGVREICCRFPRIRAFFIAFLFYCRLELSTEDVEVRDLVDFVFFFAFHYDWVRWQRFVKTVVLVGSKLIDVKDRIKLQIVG
jgi:hypothetical protein